MVDLVRGGRTPDSLSREFEPTAQLIWNWVRQAERVRRLTADTGRIPHRPGARRRAGQRRPHQLRPRRRLRHDRTPFEVGDPVDRFLSRKALEAWFEWGRPADEVQTLAFGQEPRCSATRSTGTGAASTPARARSCLAFFSMLSDIAGDLRSRSCDEGSNLVSALPCRPLDSAGDYWFGGPGSSL